MCIFFPCSLFLSRPVGGAQFDPVTGEWVGGGIAPDVRCESSGIPGDPNADLCVGMALDVLQEMQSARKQQATP